MRESYGQLQRSYQHLEKDLGRRKDRETELLTLTEKLSSANAELQAERSSWQTKVGKKYFSIHALVHVYGSSGCVCVQISTMTEEVTEHSSSLAETQEGKKKAESELAELREDTNSQISHLMNSLEQKSKAGSFLLL